MYAFEKREQTNIGRWPHKVEDDIVTVDSFDVKLGGAPRKVNGMTHTVTLPADTLMLPESDADNLRVGKWLACPLECIVKVTPVSTMRT
jgi:hypothetical protein